MSKRPLFGIGTHFKCSDLEAINKDKKNMYGKNYLVASFPLYVTLDVYARLSSYKRKKGITSSHPSPPSFSQETKVRLPASWDNESVEPVPFPGAICRYGHLPRDNRFQRPVLLLYRTAFCVRVPSKTPASQQ